MEGTNENDSRIIRRLRDLEKGEGEFSRSAKVYRELLQIQMEAKGSAAVGGPNLSEDRVQERLREGIPLLPFEDFLPDWNQVQAVSGQIIAWATADSEVSREKRNDLRTMGSDLGLLRAAAEVWYQGLSLQTLFIAQTVDVELLASVVGATLKPFLSAYSESLYPRIDQELWRRNYCPVCGGRADFSVLKEGGARWLFCSRCDTEWLFSRIECPSCGTRNQERLGYLTDEEQPGLYRVYVCEECRTYLKALDARGGGGEVLLPLERVMTLHLDRMVKERGYEPGWTIREDVNRFIRRSVGEEEKERRPSQGEYAS